MNPQVPIKEKQITAKNNALSSMLNQSIVSGGYDYDINSTGLDNTKFDHKLYLPTIKV